MDAIRDRVDKRIKRIKSDGMTYICFQDRYLLEGKSVALSRRAYSMEYFGDRFTDYGQVPSPFIVMSESVTCSNLEEMFKDEDKIDGFEENGVNINWRSSV